jgi:hypothetical protein
MANLALATGHITRGIADYIEVQLLKLAPDTPATLLISWPQSPSVIDPNPRALAAVARTLVQVLGEAQAQLAKLKASEL